MKYVIATFVAFGLPIIICFGLYTIKDKHYGVTNVCNEKFYPDLCGSPKTEPETK
jgi:hypothetical protein